MGAEPRREAESASIDPTLSIVLDFIRFSLAAIVTWGHLTSPAYSAGQPNILDGSVAAVGGFFVLSGYTIRQISARNPRFDLPRYLIDRGSRLWSVAIPALALTAAVDLTCFLVRPDFYVAHLSGASHPILIKVALNLVFVTQFWGHSIQPLSNTPFWSLGYEAAFYLFFGLWAARSQFRWALPVLLAAMLLAGPNIAVMLVFWIGGLLAYDLDRLVQGRAARLAIAAVAAVGVALMTVGPWSPAEISAAIGRAAVSAFDLIGVSPGRVSGPLIYGAVAFNLVLVILLLALPSLPAPDRLRRTARALGELTFPLYLFHVPMLVIMSLVRPNNVRSMLEIVVVFVLMILASAAITPGTTQMKLILRRQISGLGARWGAARAVSG